MVAPGDAGATASALEQLVDAERRAAFGRESHRRVVAEYAFPRFRERALALVEDGGEREPRRSSVAFAR